MESKTFVDDIPFDVQPVDLEATRHRSEPFVGRWNGLISQTNWEKGRIIVEWRADLQKQEQPAAAWSDETWSRLVGGVSPQHVGRLRRTWERFSAVWQSYEGLYWSHFFAALEWSDSEMWLEGAVQNGWSVSQMRLKQWETVGGAEGEKPDSTGRDIVTSEIEEENQSLTAEDAATRKDRDFSSSPRDEGPDFGDESRGERRSSDPDTIEMGDIPKLTTQALFDRFKDLPEDVAENVEAFQLSIIRHRAEGWAQITQEQMTDVLGALRQLAASNADAHGQ